MGAIITLLTGLTDQPLEDLGGKTPLQKAHCPALDRLAREGGCWRLHPPDHGGQEVSLLSLCGVKKGLNRAARAPLEAAALGLTLQKGQVAFCLRFAAAGEGVVVDVSNELLSDSEGKLFCDLLNQEFQAEGFRFFHLHGPRGLLLCDKRRVSKEIGSELLSPAEIVGRGWEELLPDPALLSLATRASALLAHHEVNLLKAELEEEPVTVLLFYQGGEGPTWSPIERLSTSLLLTPWHASQGAAKSVGLPTWTLPPEAHKYDHLSHILGQLPELATRFDPLFVEFPYIWESTYKGDLLEKIKAIEWIDRHWVAPLIDLCAAHSLPMVVFPLRHTDIRLGRLVSGPVPAVANLPGKRLERFDETSFESLSRNVPMGDVISLVSMGATQYCPGR